MLQDFILEIDKKLSCFWDCFDYFQVQWIIQSKNEMESRRDLPLHQVSTVKSLI